MEKKSTTEIVKQELENVKTNDDSKKKSIKNFIKDNLKLDIEDISTKKLEFSLNKLQSMGKDVQAVELVYNAIFS